MKYIDADLLRKDIEFAKSVYDNPKRVVHGVADAFRQDGRAAMCDDILKKIDSLQQEQQEEPDKGLDVTDFCKPIDPGIAQCVADHWWEMLGDKEPDKSLEEEIQRYLREECSDDDEPAVSEIARHFAEWQKEQMLKDAVEGRIGAVGLHNSIFIKEPEWAESLDRLNEGDKVKIIIVKEG